MEQILNLSHIHKSHFKSKVRHMLERLIRKFSYETVEKIVPEEDKKLILAIRKRKEALKRKKILLKKEDISGAPASKRSFDDAIQDSDSDLDSESDDAYTPAQYEDEKTLDSNRAADTLIREGEDVDFLDKSIISHLVNEKKRRSITAKCDKFKSNEQGLLIINDSDEEMEKEDTPVSEDYYKQSLHSEVAFTRTADGRVKFLNKRKRQETDQETPVGKRWNSKTSKKEQKQDVSKMLGLQYKAKKAGGDVKRAGMEDPYAYIPLKGTIVGNM